MELVQKIARRLRAGQLMSHQLSHRILSENREGHQALASCRVQNHEALYVGGLVIASLSLFDRHIPFHARRQSQRAECLHQQRDSGQRSNALVFVSFVVVKSQALLSRRGAISNHRPHFTGAPHPSGDNSNHTVTAAYLTSTPTRHSLSTDYGQVDLIEKPKRPLILISCWLRSRDEVQPVFGNNLRGT